MLWLLVLVVCVVMDMFIDRGYEMSYDGDWRKGCVNNTCCCSFVVHMLMLSTLMLRISCLNVRNGCRYG